jgi:DNA-binding transcriptional LysR family regulator
LFDRTSRRVALTPAGALFLVEARRTLEQADRAITVARRAALGELGELHLGFSASAPFIPHVATAIHDFRLTFPDVRLSLSEIAGAAQIAAVESGSIDVGFLRSSAPPVLPRTLTCSLLLEERMFIGMRPDHRLAAGTGVRLTDLADEPMVIYSNDRSGDFNENVFRLMRRAGVEPQVAQSVFEVSTLLGIVTAGVGIVIIAESLCALQSTGVVYRELLEEGASTSMWIIGRGGEASQQAGHFLRIVSGR